MEPLIEVADAKKHLRIDGTTDEDTLVEAYIDAAQEIVLDYINQRRIDGEEWAAAIDGWTEDTVPKRVRQAILVQVAELYRFRGDDTNKELPPHELGQLAPAVTALLYRMRDPAIA